MTTIKYRFEEFTGACMTEDDQAVIVAGRVGPDEVHVEVPADEIKDLLLAIGVALNDGADEASIPRTRVKALSAYQLAFDGSKAHPDSIYLNVILGKSGPSVAFLLSEASFIRFCEGVLSRFAPSKLKHPINFRDRPN